ncbi:MAG: bifunctional methylenetetrahydrofolate dehydrogenase/methenyltetrahydrofolate cyclohydrolase FolD [Nitrospinae bacterium]|nr:bifunctional methylenetetrahydrofolate dehydrogenase/methenyltetrahydrofolate cyclohydrolase FolD [Nitrospinota bacterium]
MTVKIDGKAVAASIREEIKKEITIINKETGNNVTLAVVLVGDNPASQVYVRLKEKACHEVGIQSVQHTIPAEVSMKDILNLIDALNADEKVNGILVQLPLPAHLDADKVLDRIHVDKDVDGFHPLNVGLLSQKLAKLAPCTPAGCIELLDRYNIPIQGANAVVIGRSNIVGKPVATMLLHRNATVTICHSKTKDISKVASQADIIIAAIGSPRFVTADMVKQGAAVIDVGTSKVDNAIVGDVDYENVYPKAGWITPVPGGVGPMTIAMLLSNTLLAYKIQRKLVC